MAIDPATAAEMHEAEKAHLSHAAERLALALIALTDNPVAVGAEANAIMQRGGAFACRRAFDLVNKIDAATRSEHDANVVLLALLMRAAHSVAHTPTTAPQHNSFAASLVVLATFCGSPNLARFLSAVREFDRQLEGMSATDLLAGLTARRQRVTKH